MESSERQSFKPSVTQLSLYLPLPLWADFDYFSQGISKFLAPVSNIWSDTAVADVRKHTHTDEGKFVPFKTKSHIAGMKTEKYCFLILAPHRHSCQSQVPAASSLGKENPEPYKSPYGPPQTVWNMEKTGYCPFQDSTTERPSLSLNNTITAFITKIQLQTFISYW